MSTVQADPVWHDAVDTYVVCRGQFGRRRGEPQQAAFATAYSGDAYPVLSTRALEEMLTAAPAPRRDIGGRHSCVNTIGALKGAGSDTPD